MIAKNDEEKRNQLWRTNMAVSSILIIGISAFFIIKLFTANPLEGVWSHDESSIVLTIKSGGNASLEWSAESEESSISIPMKYSMDKETKTFSLRTEEDAIEKAAMSSSKTVTEDGLRAAVSTLERTYAYSIDKKELTLTDREYGDQMIFDKK